LCSSVSNYNLRNLTIDSVLLCMFFFASRVDTTNTQVIVGNKNLTTSSPSQIVNIEDIWIHEENEPVNRKNDIALLKV